MTETSNIQVKFKAFMVPLMSGRIVDLDTFSDDHMDAFPIQTQTKADFVINKLNMREYKDMLVINVSYNNNYTFVANLVVRKSLLEDNLEKIDKIFSKLLSIPNVSIEGENYCIYIVSQSISKTYKHANITLFPFTEEQEYYGCLFGCPIG